MRRSANLWCVYPARGNPLTLISPDTSVECLFLDADRPDRLPHAAIRASIPYLLRRAAAPPPGPEQAAGRGGPGGGAAAWRAF